MATCDICGKEDLKSEWGLIRHKQLKHEMEEEPIAPVPEAIEAAVRVETARHGPKLNGRLSTGGLNHPGKRVKMIQARCNVCNPRGQGRRGWWATCSHDPYFHMEPQVGTDDFIEQADGTFIQNLNPKRGFVRAPNWKQIPDDPGITSARSVKIQQERGSVFPKDLGYAPVCDYQNCWEPNPGVHANKVITIEGASVRVGDYHTRDEAAMMTLKFNQKPTYVGVDADIENRRAQLDAVQVL